MIFVRESRVGGGPALVSFGSFGSGVRRALWDASAMAAGGRLWRVSDVRRLVVWHWLTEVIPFAGI
jgi:hypothetical protein